jgi:hypothetical protein
VSSCKSKLECAWDHVGFTLAYAAIALLAMLCSWGVLAIALRMWGLWRNE